MKTMILSTVIALVIVSPVHSSPLTWVFSGTITSPGDLNGHHFELRILLNTEVVASFSPTSEVVFTGPFSGELEIAAALLEEIRFPRVQYVATPPSGGLREVVGVNYDQAA